jgi:hypothetical protein
MAYIFKVYLGQDWWKLFSHFIVAFQEGEEVIEIEYSSEDWWTGTVASSGQRGLFPANYVELQQQ